MNIIKELVRYYNNTMIYPDDNLAKSRAFSEIANICGDNFTIFGISVDLDILEANESSVVDAFKKNTGSVVFMQNKERIHFNKKWNSSWDRSAIDEKLFDLRTLCEMLHKTGRSKAINVTKSAEIVFDEFEDYCQCEYAKNKTGIIGSIWENAHLNLIKIAGLNAISNGFYSPLITYEIAASSLDTISGNISIAMRFLKKEGKNSATESEKQRVQMYKLVREYMSNEPGNYGDDIKKLRKNGIISRSYMQKRLSNCAPFKHDYAGAKEAIYRTLGHLCADGILSRADSLYFDTKAAVYKINKSFFA